MSQTKYRWKMPMSRISWGLYGAVRNECGKRSKQAKKLEKELMDSLVHAEPFFTLERLDRSAFSKEEWDDKLRVCREMSADWKKHWGSSRREDMFRGEPVEWEHFLPYSTDWNNYDMTTQRCVICHRMTDEEIKDFREQFWIEFVDPYCDGRDCTGAPFTRYMRFFRLEDKTIIFHRIDIDV